MKIIASLLMFAISALRLAAQVPAAHWTFTYGTAAYDNAYAIAETPDGGCVALGAVGESPHRPLAIRFGPHGDMLWTRLYTGWGSWTEGFDIEPTSDGGYVIAGVTGGVASAADAFLLKINSSGDTLWWRRYGMQSYEAARAVREMPGGGFILAGMTRSISPWHDRMYLVRTDSNGDTLWTRYYAGNGQPWDDYAGANAIALTVDGGFILAGYEGLGGTDAYLVKVNASGGMLWNQSYTADEAWSVFQTVDGGYAVGGFGLGSHGSADMQLIRTTSGGGQLWVQSYGGPYADRAYAMRQLPGGGYVLGGHYYPSFAMGQEFFLVITDESGSPVSQWMWGGSGHQEIRDVQPAADGGYVIIGTTTSAGYGGRDLYVTKLCPEHADHGYVTATAPGPPDWGFTLHHQYGSVARLVFKDIVPGMAGVVSGDAAVNWSVLPGGDGNDGDSIVFVGSVPLTTGSIDTFWLIDTDDRCYATWAAECRADTVTLAHGGLIDCLDATGAEAAFAIVHESGLIRRVVFAPTAAGSMGRVSGAAASAWQALPGGDGNNGDSVVFIGTEPLAGGQLDTFWVSRRDDSCRFSWASGCRSGTESILYAGEVVVAALNADSAAFRLEHRAGRLERLAFAGIAPGTIGSVTGEAALTWQVLPNGDGNDGDSVIFVTDTPLTTGAVDTFGLTRPDDRCVLTWAAGCTADTAQLMRGAVDSLHFELSSYWPLEFLIQTWNERDLSTIELWREPTGGVAELIANFTPANDSLAHEYTFGDTWHWATLYYVLLVDSTGCRQGSMEWQWYAPGDAEDGRVPIADSPGLEIYPNPFNATATLNLRLHVAGRSIITVYDVLGRRAVVLADRYLPPGEHRFTFDASTLPSGIYFARVQAGDFVQTQKLLLLK